MGYGRAAAAACRETSSAPAVMDRRSQSRRERRAAARAEQKKKARAAPPPLGAGAWASVDFRLSEGFSLRALHASQAEAEAEALEGTRAALAARGPYGATLAAPVEGGEGLSRGVPYFGTLRAAAGGRSVALWPSLAEAEAAAAESAAGPPSGVYKVLKGGGVALGPVAPGKSAPEAGAPALGAPAPGAPAPGAPALGAPAPGAPALGAPAPGAGAPPGGPRPEEKHPP